MNSEQGAGKREGEEVNSEQKEVNKEEVSSEQAKGNRASLPVHASPITVHESLPPFQASRITHHESPPPVPRSPLPAPFLVRELSGLPELAAAEQLQLDVWGQDTIPEGRELLLAIQHSGGLAAGAFDGTSRLVGFLFGFPTRDPAVQHSHRLAVLPECRGMGIGVALKWFQRDWCLARGISLVQWTVDPLRMPNAEINARLLGATTAHYLPDYYGAMQGIDAGLPSDRFLMDWRLDCPRVAALAMGVPGDPGFPALPYANPAEDGRSLGERLDLGADCLLVRIPADFITLAATGREIAAAWRDQTRRIFVHYFARGYAVSGFTRIGGPAYLLERTSS